MKDKTQPPVAVTDTVKCKVIGDIDLDNPEFKDIWLKVVDAFPNKLITPAHIGTAVECFKAGMDHANNIKHDSRL